MKEREEDFTQLQTLLRLKRYETPPPGNVETFLYEFHRRQRAELVRRPLWRIALDRLENLLPTPVPTASPRLAYAGACVVALSLAGVGVLSHGGSKPTVAQVLSNNAPASQNAAPARNENRVAAANRRAPINLAPSSASVRFVDADNDLDSDPRFSTVPSPRLNAAATTRRDDNALRPRYVLESQPARYEPRSSTF
ncbi:MAG: hypothetical protein JO295_12155 [Verrucomicrobia bacterium]|nr:hypothetical protein [Verrucomicrobiota bacterium]